MKANTEAMVYRRQMLEMANDAKKVLTIPGNIIQNEKSDATLGRIVRLMYEQRVKDAEAHIEYIKSLEK
jgi:hypothetical protein